MRVFRSKKTNELFKFDDNDDKMIKSLEYNDDYEELYEMRDAKT